MSYYGRKRRSTHRTGTGDSGEDIQESQCQGPFSFRSPFPPHLSLSSSVRTPLSLSFSVRTSQQYFLGCSSSLALFAQSVVNNRTMLSQRKYWEQAQPVRSTCGPELRDSGTRGRMRERGRHGCQVSGK